jgi:hypothetical protein
MERSRENSQAATDSRIKDSAAQGVGDDEHQVRLMMFLGGPSLIADADKFLRHLTRLFAGVRNSAPRLVSNLVSDDL